MEVQVHASRRAVAKGTSGSTSTRIAGAVGVIVVIIRPLFVLKVDQPGARAWLISGSGPITMSRSLSRTGSEGSDEGLEPHVELPGCVQRIRLRRPRYAAVALDPHDVRLPPQTWNHVLIANEPTGTKARSHVDRVRGIDVFQVIS